MSTEIKKVNLLSDLDIVEVSVCKRGANQGAKIALFKSTEETDDMEGLDTKIEDVELLKELTEEFAKRDAAHQDLVEKIDALTKTNEELVAKSVPAPEVDDIVKELDELPESVKDFMKAKDEAFDALQKQAGESADALVAMAKEADRKDLVTKVAVFKYAVAEDDQSKTVDQLVDLSKAAQDIVLDSIAKSDAVLRTSATFKEVGGSDVNEGSAAAEIEKAAVALVKSGDEPNIYAARTTVRKTDVELAQRESDEKEAV